MSELTVDKRDVDDVTLLYPKGFINAHTVRLFDGELRGGYRLRRARLLSACGALTTKDTKDTKEKARTYPWCPSCPSSRF